MKLLVTGGAGFIGSNFIYYIQKVHPEYEIVNLDLLTYAGNLDSLKDAEKSPNYRFVHGDIADSALVTELFQKEQFDMVVNFAAESHVDRAVLNPSVFVRTNVLGTQVLLDAAKTYGVNRFHQVSTDEVYGDLPLDRPDLFFTETTPLHTSSPYSAAKAGADLLVLAYHRTFGLPVTLPVYGTGENVRDWLYVEDHCAAIDLILHKGTVGEIYNIGGHNEKTNLTVVKKILETLNKPASLISYVTDRPGHDRRYAIDPAKISAELGWTPTVAFADGIEATIRWYVEHPDWWQRILTGEYSRYIETMYGSRLS